MYTLSTEHYSYGYIKSGLKRYGDKLILGVTNYHRLTIPEHLLVENLVLQLLCLTLLQISVVCAVTWLSSWVTL